MRSVERLTLPALSAIPALTPVSESVLVQHIAFINQTPVAGPQLASPGVPAIAVKQEPMQEDEIEVDLYHKRRQGKISFLLNIHDRLEAYGIKHGPLREELIHIDADRLEINSADKKILPKRMRDSVTRQIRKIVKALQEGKPENAGTGFYHIYFDEESSELGFGLKAARTINTGEVLPDLYGGFVLRNSAECDEMYAESDNSFPACLYETKGFRPRSKLNSRRKPVNVFSGVAGNLKYTDLTLVNTASVRGEKVIASDKNNLMAIRADGGGIVYMAVREIKEGELLLINYGPRYKMKQHQPPLVKTEANDISAEAPCSEALPDGLCWLAENIDRADSWVDASFEVLPQLIALSETFRHQDALLVITKKESENTQQGNMVISVIDSCGGEYLDHQAVINTRRNLAVIEFVPHENHYNALWSPVGNVSFTLEDQVYRVDTKKKNRNRVKNIGKTGFCMTDAAAFALFKGRKDKTLRGKPFTDTMVTGIYGYELRQDIKHVIQNLPQTNRQLTECLEEKIQSIKSFEKNEIAGLAAISQEDSDHFLETEKTPPGKKNKITAEILIKFKNLPPAERNRTGFINKHQLVPRTAMKYITADGKLTLRGEQMILLAQGHVFSNPKKTIIEWQNKTDEERAKPGAKEELAIKNNVRFEAIDSMLVFQGGSNRGLKFLERLKVRARNQIEEKNNFLPAHMKELKALLVTSSSELSQACLLEFCKRNNLDENKLHYYFRENKFTAHGRAVLNRQPGKDDRITADIIREWMAMGDARKDYGAKKAFCKRNNISRFTLQFYATTNGLKAAGEKILQVEQQHEEIMDAMLKWASLSQKERNKRNAIEKFSKQHKIKYEAFRQKVLVKGIFKDKGKIFLLERGMTSEEIFNLTGSSEEYVRPYSFKKITLDIIDGYRNSSLGHNPQAFNKYCKDVGFEEHRLIRYISVNGKLTLRGKAKYKKKAGNGVDDAV